MGLRLWVLSLHALWDRQYALLAVRSNSGTPVRVARTHLHFTGIQIKSIESFRLFSASVQAIEEQTGIHQVRITLDNIFFCPWIDKNQCRETHMEQLLIDLIKRIT
jgi:hypothetical protein